jgi:hypothetical protein
VYTSPLPPSLFTDLPARLRSVRPGLPGTVTITDSTDRDLTDSGGFRESTRMLLAMARTGRPVYEGTVPAHVKARRHAANKRARVARRAARP